MVKRKGLYPWHYEHYRAVLQGVPDEGVLSLRSVARGFDAKDGYSLADFKSWTPAMRRRVREAAHEIARLTSRPKRIVRARGENLEKLQSAFHGGLTAKGRLKVAFVPDVHPERAPGLKKRPLKVRVLKHVIRVEHTHYDIYTTDFDKKSLATRSQDEIDAAIRSIAEASGKAPALYYVRTGENDTRIGTNSPREMMRMILDLMERYDGLKALDGKKRWDKPDSHAWWHWLDGISGYVLKSGKKKVGDLAREIVKGREEQRKISRKRKNLMRRKRG